MAKARQKTTVYLDVENLETIERAAREQRRSAAALIREALALYAKSLPSSMPSWVGAARTGAKDRSERVDQILKDSFKKKRLSR